MVFLSEQYLSFTVHEYVEHRYRERNRQGVGNELLTPLARPAKPNGLVQRRKRLGGLLNYYCRKAP